MEKTTVAVLPRSSQNAASTPIFVEAALVSWAFAPAHAGWTVLASGKNRT